MSIVFTACLTFMASLCGSIFNRTIMQGDIDKVLIAQDLCLVSCCIPTIIISRALIKIITLVRDLELNQEMKKENQ